MELLGALVILVVTCWVSVVKIKQTQAKKAEELSLSRLSEASPQKTTAP